MKALEVRQLGEPGDALVLGDRPRPVPGPGQVLVRVRACAANFPDILLCPGTYQVRPSLPFTPGIEASGLIEDVGAGVDPARRGQRVLGPTLLPHGGFATSTLMRDREAFLAPDGLTDAEAAAFFITYQTAWLGLHRRARLRAGEVVVVHGAVGGVGSAAVQVARAAGARVVAVVRGRRKAAAAHALAPDLIIDRLTEDWIDLVLGFTDGVGADVIVDTVGGDIFDDSTRCIASEGRILTFGFAGGRIPVAQVNHALLKNYSVVGAHLAAYRKTAPEVLAECHTALVALVEAGAIRPSISPSVRLEQVPDQLHSLSEGSPIGRIVADLSL